MVAPRFLPNMLQIRIVMQLSLQPKQAYTELQDCLLQRQRMLLGIVLERAKFAKTHCLLAYTDSPSSTPKFPAHKDPPPPLKRLLSTYCIHQVLMVTISP